MSSTTKGVEFRNAADYRKNHSVNVLRREASNSNSDRKQYGNNRYQYSNLLQWLNSNAAAGAWYSAKHSADAPPTNANVWNNYNEYDAWAGFLAMLDPVRCGASDNNADRRKKYRYRRRKLKR